MLRLLTKIWQSLHREQASADALTHAQLSLLLRLHEENHNMQAELKAIVTKMQADMATQTTVVGSFATFLSTLKEQYAAALEAAKTAGATTAELSEFVSLSAMIEQNTKTMQALTSNTVAASEPVPGAGTEVEALAEEDAA